MAEPEGGVLALVSIGRHPVSGRPRRAEFDARALELALSTGLPVTAVHAGSSDEAEGVLRDYLGAGATEVMVLDCAAGSDPLCALEAELRVRKPRLIVAGSRAEAGESSGMLPFLLTERLGYGIATEIIGVEFAQTGLRLVKALPGGRRRIIEAQSCLIVTVDRRGPTPRLSAHMPARRGRVLIRPGGPASPDDAVLWSTRPGRPRPRRLMAPILAGVSGSSDARREMIAPDPDAAAEAILDFLERDGLLAFAKEAGT
jgi:electron transfer flavoprotein beta subunit